MFNRHSRETAELFENQTFKNRGVVAQRLEHLLCKQDVEGSSPFGSTSQYFTVLKMELNRRLRRLEAAGFSEARCRRSVVTGGAGFFGESGV